MEVLGCDEVDVEVLGFGEGTFSVVNSTFFSVRNYTGLQNSNFFLSHENVCLILMVLWPPNKNILIKKN
jgi:hypothetical protein